MSLCQSGKGLQEGRAEAFRRVGRVVQENKRNQPGQPRSDFLTPVASPISITWVTQVYTFIITIPCLRRLIGLVGMQSRVMGHQSSYSALCPSLPHPPLDTAQNSRCACSSAGYNCAPSQWSEFVQVKIVPLVHVVNLFISTPVQVSKCQWVL